MTGQIMTPGAHYAVADAMLQKVRDLEESLRPSEGIPPEPERVAQVHGLQGGLATIALAHATLANVSSGTYADAVTYNASGTKIHRVARRAQ